LVTSEIVVSSVKDEIEIISLGKRTSHFRWTTLELSRKLRNGNEIIPKRLKPAP